MLAFDEIRQFGANSLQVMRRLRAALTGIAESTTLAARAEAVQRPRSDHRAFAFDSEDKVRAVQEDRQGLGLSRRRAEK